MAKIGLRGMEPFTFLWLRSLASALTVFAWILWRRGPLLPPRGNPDFWWNTALHNLNFLIFYHAVQYTTAGRASLFLYIQPILLTAFAAYFLPEERIGRRAVLGFAASAAGLVLLFSDKLSSGGGSTWLGDALTLLAAVVWSSQSLFLKVRLKGVDPFRITAWTQLMAVLPFLLLAVWWGRWWPDFTDPDVLTGVLYSGMVGTGLAMVLWVRLLAEYPAGRVSSFMFLCPVFGVFLGALLLAETLSALMLAGAALVAAGIYLVNSKKKRAGEAREAIPHPVPRA
ncbi:MAG: DMT family transporter [Candidatus Tectomicrobia bacterium]|uniref:DMT family transporter n=1 Tax=Tectimicrobiota bacterium TaxID=2528274 RepID=A0A932MN44_UNCTE|nr:DMT family transporter [Candidatus Tectomicrobia bacterium]